MLIENGRKNHDFFTGRIGVFVRKFKNKYDVIKLTKYFKKFAAFTEDMISCNEQQITTYLKGVLT